MPMKTCHGTAEVKTLLFSHQNCCQRSHELLVTIEYFFFFPIGC
ncbi:hypothetical protein E2C01_000697 [Portunus trituberculatus]|uniref:Uncharacterized protein n=1 Tax=Portunus trituberculatus TaxID=210409 RepID=A0A5B7CH90_PORTR|nr:hypothetical protein [Portunus trituberculatus]